MKKINKCDVHRFGVLFRFLCFSLFIFLFFLVLSAVAVEWMNEWDDGVIVDERRVFVIETKRNESHRGSCSIVFDYIACLINNTWMHCPILEWKWWWPRQRQQQYQRNAVDEDNVKIKSKLALVRLTNFSHFPLLSFFLSFVVASSLSQRFVLYFEWPLTGGTTDCFISQEFRFQIIQFNNYLIAIQWGAIDKITKKVFQWK